MGENIKRKDITESLKKKVHKIRNDESCEPLNLNTFA